MKNASNSFVSINASAASVATNELTEKNISIVQQLDVLAERRKVWEATDYKKANERLYSLLADCLEIFTDRFVKDLKIVP